MIKTPGKLLIVFCCQLIPWLSLPALADPVKLAGKLAFDVPCGTGKATTIQRVNEIQKNIDNALVASGNHTPSAVAVTYISGQPILTLGGFYVAAIDGITAKRLGLTPEALASRWEDGLKSAMSDPVAIDNYIHQLTASAHVPQTGTTVTDTGSYPYYRQGHVAFIPAGMTMPIVLTSSVSSEFAKPGDNIQATLAQPINLGDAQIPADSLLIGQVTDSVPGTRMSHSGELGFKFTTLRLANGAQVPINAHIIGNIGKYHRTNENTDEFHGETTGDKAKDAALRGAVGAGGGALLGTVIGAIASHGYGTGRGAWSGAVIGGALGVADSLLLRKGSNVKMESGQTLTLQLDAPAQVAL